MAAMTAPLASKRGAAPVTAAGRRGLGRLPGLSTDAALLDHVGVGTDPDDPEVSKGSKLDANDDGLDAAPVAEGQELAGEPVCCPSEKVSTAVTVAEFVDKPVCRSG
ncbi:hypothetical protein G6O67_000575 [Ophiocordyceps sinensis]|uniref:Uncharacterized protein n=1 Tax=Ophiocordyceps sinensis TaxID=72228 RepID=A0A8H4PZH8_9HYPO|nr:hypothetical protein G6O67_000575 [Ophiocordyceps sinensis]